MSPELRRAFAGSIYGHPNAYGMFLHAGIEIINSNLRTAAAASKAAANAAATQTLRVIVVLMTEISCLNPAVPYQ